MRCLEEDGLLTDQDVMDDIWQELSKDAKLFQEHGTSRLRLSFPRWREMMLQRLPPDITVPEQALTRANQQVLSLRIPFYWGWRCGSTARKQPTRSD